MKRFFTLPGEPETVALTEKAEQTNWNEASNYHKYIVVTPAGELSGYLYKDGDRFIISDDQDQQKIINAGDITELWRVLSVTNKSPDDMPGLPVI